MNRAELAAQLVAVDASLRVTLLSQHSSLADSELAHVLKTTFDQAKSSDPVRATEAAAALSVLAKVQDLPEISALAAWTAGMVALQFTGQIEEALERLDTAIVQFEALELAHQASAVQVSKVYAFAVLGRYDEAIACGLAARNVLLAHDDILSAGKIEQNLGNLYWRRDQYDEAEQFYGAAREHFVAVGDQKELALVHNNMANVQTSRYKFREAVLLYEQALAQAQIAGLEVLQAIVEGNLGYLALFQGSYDQALNYLEQSRRRYTALNMPHESAVADLELADAYLELNLVPEAIAIYARVTPTFAALGMRAEQARSLAYHGQACLLVGHLSEARPLLAEAQQLYDTEGNVVGSAMVALIRAQLYAMEGNYLAAAAAAASAEIPFAAAGAWGKTLQARWLRGEAARILGQHDTAYAFLESTLRDADSQALPQVAQRCHTSLGLLATSLGDGEEAEACFGRAVALVEELRAPLPGEEFRTAFIADKLTAYDELVRLCLVRGGDERAVEALRYVERARSRALLDMMSGAPQVYGTPRDSFEAGLLARLEELREELNWFYNQVNRPPDDEVPEVAAMAALHAAIQERKATVLEIMRQLQQRGGDVLADGAPLDVAALQYELGTETALVEYWSLDGELLAFVVTDEQVAVVRSLGREDQVEATLEQVRFQIDALRYGATRMRSHMPQLTLRAQHYLGQLYDTLVRPIEALVGERRVVIVPHRALHYVPFHALYDGAAYMVEQREVCYAPSASILMHCRAARQQSFGRAVLLGLADEQTPRVRDELQSLAPLFASATVLLDQEATHASLRAHASQADIVHLACHGQFRPDNPLFSSLRLADGWLTVRDAYSLDLSGLVTLSACETGVSDVMPGDELVGLARGFFRAGATLLLVSLWAVDDAATATLMADFYTYLQNGAGPAAALRHAQLNQLQQQPHPFFWSPFVLLGSW